MNGWVLSVALAGLSVIAQGDLDCARPAQSRTYIAKLRLAEFEWAEDVHREAMWHAFGRCPSGPRQAGCRAEQQKRFDAEWQTTKAGIEAKYKKMEEDFEVRCRTSVT